MAKQKSARRNSQTPIPNPPLEEGNGNGAGEEREPKKGGAQVNIVVRGSPRETREALLEVGGENHEEGSPQEEVQEEDIDPLEELLSNPKYQVIVKRQTPMRWQGEKTDVEVARYNCPITMGTIRDDVFERFGGHRFVVTAHPNTPNGESKILGGTTITNTETQQPLDEGTPIGIVEDGLNPSDGTEVPERVDPLAAAQEAVSRKLQRKQQRIELKEANRTLRELDEDDDEENPKKGDAASQQRIAELERKLADQSLEGRLNSKIDSLASMITAQKPVVPAAGGDSMSLMIKLIESSDNRMTKLIETMSANTERILDKMTKSGERTDEDKLVDRMMKYKTLFGGGESEGEGRGGGRTSRLENTLIEMALSQFGIGKAGELGEDDPIKFAVKELSPILKTYVEKKMEKENVKQDTMTEEQKKQYLTETAKQFAVKMVQQMMADGKIIPLGPANQVLPQGQPAPQGAAPAPTPGQPPQGATTPAPIPNQPPKEEGPPVELPPSPQSPAYDRKKSVDFILDVAIKDIKKGCPPTSYLMGDILDRLDDEMLDGITKLETGDQLRDLLRPWATPEKLAAIEEAGKDVNVKQWLKSCIVTVQNEYLKELKEAEAQPPK